jgi:hypothetical protein
VARAGLLTIPNPLNFSVLKDQDQRSALDMTQQKSDPDDEKPGVDEEEEEAQLLPVFAATTPEQMAALLGPSWKSRQPRLCQYCQRMFSNKFNLKQVCEYFNCLLI